MNTLPFNILSAIFAPLFVPWIEWTLDRKIGSGGLAPIMLRADRVKPEEPEDFTPQKPKQDVLATYQILDDVLNPFIKGLPGACIGNIIWGLTFDLENFSSLFFCVYIILLFVCLGMVNIVKTKYTKNPKKTVAALVFVAILHLLITSIRLFFSYR